MSNSWNINVEIVSEAGKVWETLMDVERWPEWTASITRAERMEAVPLRIGSRVRIHQPRLRPTVWTVTELEPGRSFTWVSRIPGLRTAARHSLEETRGTTQVTLNLRFQGLLAPVLAALTGELNDRYLRMEAAGLKRHSETEVAQ